MSLDEFAAQAAAYDELKAAHTRALKQLEKQRLRKQELTDAVYQAAKDSLASFTLPKTIAPKDRRKQQGETAIAVLSDWQLAKTTVSYSSDICERRIREYGEKLIQLAAVQRADHPVRDLRVYLLGDLVEGELIFPGQAHLVDASLYRQVTVDGPRILGGFLRSMLPHFERIRVVGVIGNHGALGGRGRRDMHPESNADAMMYEITRLLLADEPRVDWPQTHYQSGERAWCAVDQVGDKKFFMFHGDQVKGGALGYAWYGFGKKLLGWRDKFGFDYSLSGHFHTPTRFKAGSITHWGNGSTESDNTYALEWLAAQGTPSQWLLFAHPERGVTAEYEVHLA